MMLSSLATFGRLCGGSWKLNSFFLQLVILKLMEKNEIVNRNLSQLLHVIIQKNLKSWEECLPFIEFAYNRIVYSTIDFSSFEIVMGLIH